MFEQAFPTPYELVYAPGLDAGNLKAQDVSLFPDGALPSSKGGQQYLKDSVGAVEGDVGKGKIYLFGPEIVFRSQPHGTFKFLFNAIYLAGATPATLP